MQNMVVLLAGWVGGLAALAVAVRGFAEGDSMQEAPFRRLWQAIVHPKRRGLPDPTWPQVWIAVTAFGTFLIALASATAPVRASHTPGLGPSNSPNGWILIPGLVFASLGFVGILGMAIVALLRRRDDQIIPFSLHYQPGESNCEEIFNVDANLARNWNGQQLRVGVTNIGRQGVQRVRVFMRTEGGVWRSYFLHLQHDNDAARQASRNGEHLTIGQMAYFDLAIVKDYPGLGHFFWFCYADSDISEMSRLALTGPMEWNLRLEVSGWTDFRDVLPLVKNFRLAIDDQFHMTLTEKAG